MRSLWLPDMDWVGDRRAVNVAVVLRMRPDPVVPFFPCHALVEPGSCRVARKLVARLTVLKLAITSGRRASCASRGRGSSAAIRGA